MARKEPRVVIVGAGFGGIGMAIELTRHGFRDVTVLERADDLGGTWFHNRYPGAACDVPSHLYSFSFARRRDWSRLCSPQPEILDYIHDVARRFGVDRLVRTGVEVTACAWSDTDTHWTVSAADGRTWEADAVVVATGQLHRPAYPGVPGRETFAGHAFHSGQWDHRYPLEGKRVAVIGTGASAVQFVPEIAARVQRLTVFQRTGNWFVGRRNRRYPPLVKAAIEHLPGLQAYRRWFVFHYGEFLTFLIRHPRSWGQIGRLMSTVHMRRQLRNAEVRRRAWPDYQFGCKRILFSSYFLPALELENVELVSERITEIVPEGLLTADGRRHEVDCIIYGTGFRTTDFMFPMEITGTGAVPLRERWAMGPYAHHGIVVPGYPSLFLVYGPNTNTSGGSIIHYEEMQARYIRQALEHVREAGAAAIEVREDVAGASDRALQERFSGTAWTMCDSWYRDESGRIVTNWPGYMREFAQAVERLEPAEFELIADSGRDPSALGATL